MWLVFGLWSNISKKIVIEKWKFKFILLAQRFCFLHIFFIYLAPLILLLAPFMFYTKKRKKENKKILADLVWPSICYLPPDLFVCAQLILEKKIGPILFSPIFVICLLVCLFIHRLFWKKKKDKNLGLSYYSNKFDFFFFSLHLIFFTPPNVFS